jgi:ThiF family
MPLTDAQIDRYSRQIILPEIGGRGQERILAARVALLGTGTLAMTAGRYLTGAGIGELRLGTDAVAMERALCGVNPDVTVHAGPLDATTTIVIAADLTPAALADCVRQARVVGVPLIAAARLGDGGWIHVPDGADDCAVCAARAAAAMRGDADTVPLQSIATGVLGSLLALAALERALGRRSAAAPLSWFDAATSLLSAVPINRYADCAVCPSDR